MRELYYSESCNVCLKLIEYLEKNNIINQFRLIDINKNEKPKEVDVVPTIIDSDLNQPQKGKQAFEYLLNIKYFNNPTNNIEYVKNIPPNPKIENDKLASMYKSDGLEIVNETQTFYDDNKDNELSKISQNMADARQKQEKTLAVLLRLKKK
jgi:arsenate reductase-like glutaredoxin family protein